MPLRNFVDRISSFLARQSRRRSKPDFEVRNRPNRKVIAESGMLRCEYSAWTGWTKLRVFQTCPGKCDEDLLQITIEFNAETVGPPPHSPRSMRRVFREKDLQLALSRDKIDAAAAKALSIYRFLPINEKTHISAIREILAIYLMQKCIYDSSLEEMFLSQQRLPRPIASYLMSRLVESFVEPDYAGSYQALRKYLIQTFKRERLFGSPENRNEGLEEKSGDILDKTSDRSEMREPVGSTKASGEYFLPKDVAELKNVSVRTLYDLVKKKKITSDQDEHGNLILSNADLQDLNRYQTEKALRRNLIEFWVQKYEIKPESARNRLRRKLLKGESLIPIAKSEQGFHEWLRSRR